jgi:hypothetical protein
MNGSGESAFPLPYDALGPLEGFRIWARDDDELSSPFMNWSWDPVPRRAVCLALQRHGFCTMCLLLKDHHRPPVLECQCGYFAFSNLDLLAREVIDVDRLIDGSLVLGRVKGWGRVIPHEHGWRAEFARPLAFYELSELPGGARPYVIVEESGVIPLHANRRHGTSPIAGIARRFGVPRLMPPPGLRTLLRES